jgi:hypothetical protein
MVSLWAGVGGATAEEERIRLEAQCLAPLHNGRPLAPGNPAPSTRKMAAELARMQVEADPAVVSFLSARRATEFEKAYAETLDVRRKLGLGLELGMQQLNAGRPDFALETFSRLNTMASEAGGRLGQGTLDSLRRYRAISFLRLGEQENCIGAHGPDSCLFPLVPAAFHKVERGSRKAMEQLAGILKANTNELEIVWPGSGTQQRFTDLAMDVAYRIREDATAPDNEPLGPFRFPKTPNPKNAPIPTQRPAANGS